MSLVIELSHFEFMVTKAPRSYRACGPCSLFFANNTGPFSSLCFKRKYIDFEAREIHTKFRSRLRCLLDGRKRSAARVTSSVTQCRAIALATSEPDLQPPPPQSWASATTFFVFPFPSLPFFILTALYTPSHLHCVFLNVFLK